jgi:PAS domain S-box-containing protein
MALPNPADRLNETERQILSLLLDGWANKAVAAHLKVSVRTVERYRSRALQKIGAQSLVQAARLGVLAQSEVPAQPPLPLRDSHPAGLPPRGVGSPQHPEWYATAFRNSAAGFIAVDRQARILAANAAFSRLVGRTESQLVGTSVEALTYRDDLPRDAARNRAFLAGEIEWFRSEKRYTRPEGDVVPVHLTGGLVRSPEGAVLFGVGTVVPGDGTAGLLDEAGG